MQYQKKANDQRLNDLGTTCFIKTMMMIMMIVVLFLLR